MVIRFSSLLLLEYPNLEKIPVVSEGNGSLVIFCSFSGRPFSAGLLGITSMKEF